ncbi:MAG TPA: hypothetical protein VE650_03210 [Acetobacteraceae bacterium]|nr:hypothetical protein [Acetobacteraceae bacterium]
MNWTEPVEAELDVAALLLEALLLLVAGGLVGAVLLVEPWANAAPAVSAEAIAVARNKDVRFMMFTFCCR